ncbi:MAG: cytochrome c-type biogenesis protein [Parvularcula sp.]
MIRRVVIGLACLGLAIGAAVAQPGSEPSRPSDDPEVEARVQELAHTLRCVVCKNQSIAESNAGLAKDMVGILRDQIEAGATDEEARAFMVDRYGEFVLMQPTLSWKNAGLWAGPLMMLILGGGLAIWFIRRRPAVSEGVVPALSDQERAELAERLHQANPGGDPVDD